MYPRSGGGDPFAILGLEGGKDNTTIEDATKARRKLALKWHPDRNIDNIEDATAKMQEINEAYNAVEKILSRKDDNGECTEKCCSESESESEYDDRKKRYKQNREHKEGETGKKGRQGRRSKTSRENQQGSNDTSFEQRMKEERNRFERAYRAAQRGELGNSKENDDPPISSKKAAKKRAKRRKNRRKAMQQKQNDKKNHAFEKRNGCSTNGNNRKQSKGNSSTNNGTTTNIDTNKQPITEKDIPFHQLFPEQRCEIKFESAKLTKSPLFIAIREHTWSVFQVMGMVLKSDVSDPIPHLEPGVVVTPLHVACLLGDDKAAAVIIQLSGSKWDKAVLTTTRNGEDCLALAMESLSIAKKLYEESKVGSDNEQCKERVEMATCLVSRIECLKKHGLQKKKKRCLRVAIVGVVGYLLVTYLIWLLIHSLSEL